MTTKINDRDLTELSGFWVYQKIHKNMDFKVNGKKFREIDSFEDNDNNNTKGASDIKTFELLDKQSVGTGQQVIVFQGTDNEESINPKNPLKGNLADDWLQNIKLMNDKNKSTPLLKQNDEYIKNYQTKIEDAKKLTEKQFYKKYTINRNKFQNKTLVGFGGNSQGGASSKFQGIQHPDTRTVATDPATIPLAALDKYKKPEYKNIISYHSSFDILSWAQDSFIKDDPGQRVELLNGVPTLDNLANSHLGYKRKFNEDKNTYKNLPISKIKSVKGTKDKKGNTVHKTIKINMEMDDRIPINVWTNDAIATSGKGGLIKLDINKLGDLNKLVTGETSTMLTECVTFLEESYNISEVEYAHFGERKNHLKQSFKNEICLDSLQNAVETVKTEEKFLEGLLVEVNAILMPIRMFIPPIGSVALGIAVHKISQGTIHGIEAIHDTLDNVLSDMFKNIDHDFQDGVTEEMMKHLEIVSQNIKQVKQQNDIYGRQIGDIKNIMSQQDATVMDGNLSLTYSGENMVSGNILPSQYLTSKMTILKKHIDNAVEKLSEKLQELYIQYFKPVFDNITELVSLMQSTKNTIKTIKSLLDTKEIKSVLKHSPFSDSAIRNCLDSLNDTLDKWLSLLEDLKAASPILEGHLDDIIANMKPMIVQMIFEPSHYDDMFNLNTQAQARLDQMAQQFEVVCNGLNENDGQAIKTMDDSAALIRENIKKVKEQVEKLAMY